MTQQEIFDKVSKHLLTQMARAIDDSGVCYYRDGKGHSCAIGYLIPDELYDPCLEGRSAGAFCEPNRLTSHPPHIVQSMSKCYEVGTALGFTQELDVFLVMLQGIHDGYEPEEWQEELKKFALNWKLAFNA